MDPKIWQELNNLHGLLIGLGVLALVDAHYRMYKNPAPGELLNEQINRLNDLLKEHYPHAEANGNGAANRVAGPRD